MPFEQASPRPFNLGAVNHHAPSGSGVYGISNALEWIYIGETDNIRAALLGHLKTQHTPILSRKPTGFVFEVCGGTNRPARQDRLVFEYDPACNRLPESRMR
jgi:hypothetical protein